MANYFSIVSHATSPCSQQHTGVQPVMMCNDTMISFTGFEGTVDNEFPIKCGLFYQRHSRRLSLKQLNKQGERHQYLRLSIKVVEIETHDLYFSLQQQVSMPYPFPKTKCVRYMGAGGWNDCMIQLYKLFRPAFLVPTLRTLKILIVCYPSPL